MTPLDEYRSRHPASSIAVDGAIWNYTRGGSGDRVVLLLPGALASHDSLFPLAADLEQDSRVIGVSSAPLSSFDRFERAILAILAAENAERVHLVGQSFGGWLAQQFAVRNASRVRSLILVHAFTLMNASGGGYGSRLRPRARFFASCRDPS